MARPTKNRERSKDLQPKKGGKVLPMLKKYDMLEAAKKNRLRMIDIAKDKYEASIFQMEKVKELLYEYSQMAAGLAFDQGEIGLAAAFSVKPEYKDTFERCQKAFHRLNAPMCNCHEIDEKTGQGQEPKSTVQFTYRPDLNKMVVFILCAACEELFALTVDEDGPVNPDIEKYLIPKRAKRPVDAERDREMFLKKAA